MAVGYRVTKYQGGTTADCLGYLIVFWEVGSLRRVQLEDWKLKRPETLPLNWLRPSAIDFKV